MSSPPAVVARRFEFRQGHSNRFWETSLRGTDVLVRYGRIGAAGQGNVKSFPDPQAAAKHVERMIRQKTAKGYRAAA